MDANSREHRSHARTSSIAVLHLNADWGRTSKDIFVKAADDMGAWPVQ
jgi:hypothetical protein